MTVQKDNDAMSNATSLQNMVSLCSSIVFVFCNLSSIQTQTMAEELLYRIQIILLFLFHTRNNDNHEDHSITNETNETSFDGECKHALVEPSVLTLRARFAESDDNCPLPTGVEEK